MEPDEYTRMDAVEARMWWYRALHARLLDALADGPGPCWMPAAAPAGPGAHAHAPRAHRFGLEWHSAAAGSPPRNPAARSRAAASTNAVRRDVFGTVIAADVLCHAAVEPPQALAEISRVLRPGGRLIVNMPAFRSLMSAHDVQVHNARRMNASETAAMLRDAGLRPSTSAIGTACCCR